MVARWVASGVLVFADWGSRNLRLQCLWRRTYPLNRSSWSGRLAGMESQNGRTDRMDQRPLRAAAALHHGLGRNQCAAHDRYGIRGFAIVVPKWAIPGLRLVAQIRSRSSRRAGHLYNGRGQQDMGAVDA